MILNTFCLTRRLKCCSSKTPQLLHKFTLHLHICSCQYMVISECVPTLLLPSTLLSLACWLLGLLGTRDLHCFNFHQTQQLLSWRLGWKEVLLLLALAGPASNLKDALLHSSLGCYMPSTSLYVADCI